MEGRKNPSGSVKTVQAERSERVEVRDRSPIRRGEEGDDLEERITRVVMRVMREKSAKAGQYAMGLGPAMSWKVGVIRAAIRYLTIDYCRKVIALPRGQTGPT